MVYLQIFVVVFIAIFWAVFGVLALGKFLDIESDLKKNQNEFLNSSF